MLRRVFSVALLEIRIDIVLNWYRIWSLFLFLAIVVLGVVTLLACYYTRFSMSFPGVFAGVQTGVWSFVGQTILMILSAFNI